jgi:hypothetical protein
VRGREERRGRRERQVREEAREEEGGGTEAGWGRSREEGGESRDREEGEEGVTNRSQAVETEQGAKIFVQQRQTPLLPRFKPLEHCTIPLFPSLLSLLLPPPSSLLPFSLLPLSFSLLTLAYTL